jgi:isopentenyl diphosphate isomerase/L-lactate dehydrogenase-like FMN-dependent dehydrogenase
MCACWPLWRVRAARRKESGLVGGRYAGSVNPEGLDADGTNAAELFDGTLDDIETVFDLSGFEPLARRRMAPDAFDYYAGGAMDESTLRESVSAFSRWRLRPRVLKDVSKIDMTAEVLATSTSLPVGLGPTALQGLADPEGEIATARAAAEAGVIFCLSTLGSHTIEEVGAASHGRKWFQLYVGQDRNVSRSLVARAEAAGFEALVVTVDLPVVGYRERDLRNRFTVTSELYGNLAATDPEGRPFHEVVGSVSDPSLSWADLAWVRQVTALPLVIKGILTSEDARLAVEHGVDAIVVSNHGGRQLDRAITSLDALEEVAQAVGGRAEIYLDGGVRRGTDVVTALALGARSVFIGRPYLWALAAGGRAGVARALELIAAEIENSMALLGTRNLAEITRAHVIRV